MRDRINWPMLFLWVIAISAIAIGTAREYYGQ